MTGSLSKSWAKSCPLTAQVFTSASFRSETYPFAFTGSPIKSRAFLSRPLISQADGQPRKDHQSPAVGGVTKFVNDAGLHSPQCRSGFLKSRREPICSVAFLPERSNPGIELLGIPRQLTLEQWPDDHPTGKHNCHPEEFILIAKFDPSEGHFAVCCSGYFTCRPTTCRRLKNPRFDSTESHN